MKDYKYYEHLHNKLLTISNLKESMKEKVKSNPKLELTFKNFNEQFSESTTLQKEFYELMLDNIEDSLELSKTMPNKLMKSIKVLEIADMTQQVSPTFFSQAQNRLKKMVKTRFDEQLEGTEDDLAQALELAKFSVDDLLAVHSKLVQLFPIKYEVFPFLQKEYKFYVEKLITPYLEDLGELKENPGNIIVFLSWLEGYEALLKRAGVLQNDYGDLKEVNFLQNIIFQLPKFEDKFLTPLIESVKLHAIFHEPY